MATRFLFRHIAQKNYRATWKYWGSINPTQAMVFALQNSQQERTMPSAIRKMKLNEAFDTMGEEGEIRMVEIAQMLAERFPKLIALQEDGSANDSNAIAHKLFWPPMAGTVLLM